MIYFSEKIALCISQFVTNGKTRHIFVLLLKILFWATVSFKNDQSRHRYLANWVYGCDFVYHSNH